MTVRDMNKLVEFDKSKAALHYVFKFHRAKEALAFTRRCGEYGHTNEALVNLVQGISDRTDGTTFFHVGRESSRVLYALPEEGTIHRAELGRMARGAGCDEFDELVSNFAGHELWRFWWD